VNNNITNSCNHLHLLYLFLLLLNQLLVTAAPVVTRITGAASQVIKMNNDTTLSLFFPSCLGVSVHDDDDDMASLSSSAEAKARRRNHAIIFPVSGVVVHQGRQPGGWSVSAFHGYKTLSLPPVVCVYTSG